MKGRFFSNGIFAGQFRQLRIIGIIGCVLYVLFGVFCSIGINISQLRMEEYSPDSFSLYVENVNGVFLCTVQLLIPLIFVPLLMLTAFHFLTKRNSSDFYHALPVKREAMYTGTLAAVFVWAFIITVLPLLVMWVVCFPLKAVNFAFTELLKAALNTLTGCLFMIGVMALGINISGTLFTNIISSGIVLLLPRFVMVMFWVISGAMITDSVIDYHFVRLMLYGNPLTKTIYSAVMYGEEAVDRFVLSGIAAGAVEGLAYIIAGGVFFKLRKSESASMSSVSRAVQSVIRHLLALVFSTIASVFVVEYICCKDSDEFVIFMAVLFYVLSLVVYFLYELITTRRWKSAAKSARQLPFLGGATAVIFAVMCFISINGNEYRMNAENAEYIKIIEVSRLWGEENFLDDGDFPAEIRSGDIKKLIAKAYNSSADGEVYHSAGTVAVAIRENGVTRKRYVRLNEADMGSVLGEIYDIVGVDISQKLPDIKNSAENYRVGLYWNIIDPCELTAEEVERVYYVLRSEILESENYAVFLYGMREKTLCVLELRGYEDMFGIELPIGVTTPKTFKFVQELIREHNTARGFAEIYETVFNRNFDTVDVNGCISFVSDEYNDVIYYGVSTYSEENGGDETELSKIYEILKKYDPYGDPEGENVIIESSSWYYGENARAFGVYNLSGSDMNKLWNIIEGGEQD